MVHLKFVDWSYRFRLAFFGSGLLKYTVFVLQVERKVISSEITHLKAQTKIWEGKAT